MYKALGLSKIMNLTTNQQMKMQVCTKPVYHFFLNNKGENCQGFKKRKEDMYNIRNKKGCIEAF
jgi:hypothetical protein